MAAKDLITLARAKQNIQSITDTSQDALLTTLITAISDGIEKYCRRDFYARFYDELYSGTGDHRLLLREYPIQAVQSVRYRLVTVLEITNTNQALNQQARVRRHLDRLDANAHRVRRPFDGHQRDLGGQPDHSERRRRGQRAG